MPDPVVSSTDPELRAHVERVLSSTYELDREIGRGGMGIVYKARDRRLKRLVAIKVLPPELSFRSEIRTRFLREAETAAQLSHPNIVPIYSVDEQNGMVYFVMALVEGENLAVRLHRQGAIDAEESRRVLLEVARALDYAHQRGVVHRDIKPDNILIQQDGRVLVTDFGIARAVTEGADARLTATGMAIGTPAYMSPEQSMGERTIDGRSDLYSLGVVAYQMLTGELPFDAQSTPALLVKHLSERPTPIEERRPDLPLDLGRAVMLCLEKEPANRFPSAGALAVALETGNVPALPQPVATAAPSPRRQATWAPPAPDAGGLRPPTPEERLRWNNAQVVAFRKKLAPWIVVGVASIALNIVANFDVTWFWGFWSVYIAFQYAKLWQEGYDWRDVFKQPRDRLFFDVVAEWTDNVRALWDPRKRVEVRERARARTLGAASLFEGGEGADRPVPRGAASGASRGLATLAGAHGNVVREAARQRDDILRLHGTLSKRDREAVSDVPATANALFERVEALAVNLSELERNVSPNAAEAVESEISALEAQANPLDLQASEERVRRLAYLKRQRRQIADLDRRRDRTKEQMESCALALQNMGYDLMRLQSGRETLQHVTLVAERAMALAKEVDTRVYVADEMAKLNLPTGSRRRSR
ncbi:MAG TPA: protein kinase [Gemmatimonadaceae bacterium]|nr:protein kinase [Gemmatimonadaceae bacterium]